MHEQSRVGPAAPASELVQAAEVRLQVRLGRTANNVQIIAHEDGVVLAGRASTYYAKQLAQHVAMEIFGPAHVVNEINVC